MANKQPPRPPDDWWPPVTCASRVEWLPFLVPAPAGVVDLFIGQSLYDSLGLLVRCGANPDGFIWDIVNRVLDPGGQVEMDKMFPGLLHSSFPQGAPEKVRVGAVGSVLIQAWNQLVARGGGGPLLPEFGDAKTIHEKMSEGKKTVKDWERYWLDHPRLDPPGQNVFFAPFVQRKPSCPLRPFALGLTG